MMLKEGVGKRMIILIMIVVSIVALIGYNQYKLRKAERNFPPKGKFITVEGVKLHYIQKGSGQPIVFLHGGVLTGNDFEQVMEITVQKGYQAIAFDRPGYGYSDRPSKSITPLDQARLIHSALNKLGIEKPILVGHSWSGLLVLSYALSYPNDVLGMVLLGGAMYVEGYPAANGDPISKVVMTPILGDMIVYPLLRSPLGTMLTKNMLKETFAPERVPSKYQEATISLWLRPKHFKANRADVLAFVPTAKEISKIYHKIKQPVIMAVGENDPFGTIEQAKRLKQDIPQAKLIILPDIAHMIPQNHPQAVVKLIDMISDQVPTK